MASLPDSSTESWLRAQWSNPRDIFNVLLIVGGDVVQVAIAQLCGGPIPGMTPVVFSFGWVMYSFSALLSAVGANTLMPKPDHACYVINASNGYRRENCSWVLARILRDFDDWKDPDCDYQETIKLKAVHEENDKRKKPRPSADIRIGLRISVWQCVDASGKTNFDFMYLFGFLIAALQVGIAIVPWILYEEWMIFTVTIAGTVLAFASGGLPQWVQEKFGVRHIRSAAETKNIFLTQGNGDHDVLLILGCDGGLDLEALASPHRELQKTVVTKASSFVLAMLWLLLLISVAGENRHTWFLMLVGVVGMLHNVAVAGMPRHPNAFGLKFAYVQTFVDTKVMAVLWAVEQAYPRAGASLLNEFFPGRLHTRERLLWDYADRRYEAYRSESKKYKTAWLETIPAELRECEVERLPPYNYSQWQEKVRELGLPLEMPTYWSMPSLHRPAGQTDDSDILAPSNGSSSQSSSPE